MANDPLVDMTNEWNRVRRVLQLSPDEQERFNSATFMGMPLGEMNKSDLQGLAVWIIRNRDYIGDFDQIPNRAMSTTDDEKS